MAQGKKGNDSHRRCCRLDRRGQAAKAGCAADLYAGDAIVECCEGGTFKDRRGVAC